MTNRLIINTVMRISIKRLKIFLVMFTLIMVISILIPIMLIAYFYRTGVARIYIVPVLDEAWYFKMPMSKLAWFADIVEGAMLFYTYPAFVVVFQDPLVPMIFYTYGNLIKTTILSLMGSLLICLYSEYISIKSSNSTTVRSTMWKNRSIVKAGTTFPALVQGVSVAYAGVIVSSICHGSLITGSLIVQLSLMGLMIVTTPALTTYISSINFIAAILIELIFIFYISKKINRSSLDLNKYPHSTLKGRAFS